MSSWLLLLIMRERKYCVMGRQDLVATCIFSESDSAVYLRSVLPEVRTLLTGLLNLQPKQRFTDFSKMGADRSGRAV
jgi:hypothetical protein